MKNVLLHGDLQAKIYMKIPQGFDKGVGSYKVYKLNKVLYGLKQSPKA